MRVSASDEDADNNGAIRYSLAAPFQRDDLKYFDIQPESGWIFLKRPLDVSINFDFYLIVLKYRSFVFCVNFFKTIFSQQEFFYNFFTILFNFELYYLD